MTDKMTNSAEEVQELTAQFYVTLRACVARLGPDADTRAPKSRQDIETLLNADEVSWSNAYQIEQLLVDLFDDATLEVEVQSRLIEAESNLHPCLTANYVALTKAATTSVARRALLARLVNDLQWRHTVNEVKRTYSKAVSKSTGLIFILAVALFAAAVVVLAFFNDRDWRSNSAVLLLIAGLAGGWGAGFSMLASLKSRLDAAEFNDLKLTKSKWILWSRPLIGVGAASILYFFLRSGLLMGPVFPELSVTPGTDIPPKSLALLIVWCFIAGFSERLVPTLLAKTENRAAGPSDPDRFKPDSADTTATRSASKEPTVAEDEALAHR
jgi:hypothetical protein